MHRIWKKENVLTIPNLLTCIRLLLIPLIVWLYCGKRNYTAAAGVIVLSGITDIADGIIARKFNVVSDLGKILDPVADKLTQAAMMLCLLSRYEWMLWLFLFFAVKELSTGTSGLLVIRKKDVVNSAKWFGKLSTVVLDVVMFLLSLVKYLLLHARLLREQEAAS